MYVCKLQRAGRLLVGVTTMVVVVLVCLVTLGEAKRARCKGVWEDKSWEGQCYDLEKPGEINYHSKKGKDNELDFCENYVQSISATDDICLCTTKECKSITLKELDKEARELYENARKYVIEKGHYIYTQPLSDYPDCVHAIKKFSCNVVFPSCNDTKCQYCSYLNTFLEVCLGTGSANYRLCDLKTWELDNVPRSKRTCDCCQHNPVKDLTNYWDEEGKIVRIDQHTGANLFLTNHVLGITSCSMSVCGSFMIIISFFIFRDRLATFHLRLILYLSINDFIQAFLHGIDHAYNLSHGYIVPGHLCQATGWYVGTFLVGNMCWMVAIVYYLHKIVVRQKTSTLPDWAVIAICVIFPNYHLFPLIQFPNLSYGPRGTWCYIQDNQLAWQIVFLAVPAYVAWIIVVVLYSHIIFVILRSGAKVDDADSQAAKNRKHARSRLVRRLLGYPLIFTIQFAPLTAEFLILWVNGSAYALTISDIVTVSFVNLSGFMNFVWFFYNEKMFYRYKALILHGDKGESHSHKSDVLATTTRPSGSSSEL